MLITSYETFRIHAERFSRPDACDLLICDEAHRLKNDQTLTNKVGFGYCTSTGYCQQLQCQLWMQGGSYRGEPGERRSCCTPAAAQALGSLACKRRVLLSGTPLQNHLDEFYGERDH